MWVGEGVLKGRVCVCVGGVVHMEVKDRYEWSWGRERWGDGGLSGGRCVLV